MSHRWGQFDVSRFKFARYRVCLEGVELRFWATSEMTEVMLEELRREDVPEETIDPQYFGDDFGENVRCGNVYEAVPRLCQALHEVSIGPSNFVLELGAGVGLPGLWVSMTGASVVLSDKQQAVLQLLQRNATMNRVSNVQVRELSWGEQPAWMRDFDVVIAADVLYEEDVAQSLFATVGAALRPGGVFLLAQRERSNVDMSKEFIHASVYDLDWCAGEVPSPYSGIVEVFRFVKGHRRETAELNLGTMD